MSESEYKNLLFQISKRLDNRNAGKQLLVICRGKVAARRDEENIPTFTLFVELEVKGFLSSDRLTVLKAILKGVKEWDFLEEVEKFECRRKNYNNLLEKIIRVLDVLNDLERLISICRGNITEGRRASIHDVRSLFRELESNGCLGIDCLTTLKEILIQTEKIDLLKRVNMLEQHHFIDGADIMRIVGDSLSRQLDEDPTFQMMLKAAQPERIVLSSLAARIMRGAGALVWSFVRQMTGAYTVVPEEITLRGPLAVEAYNKALNEGKARVKRLPIMVIGQDRSGKTSLKNSMLGKPFNPDEDSTVGIDVGPSHFNVSTDICMQGENTVNNQAQNDFREALSFEHHMARLVVEVLTHHTNNQNSKDDLPSNEAKIVSSSVASKNAIESGQESGADSAARQEEKNCIVEIPDEVAERVKNLLQEVEEKRVGDDAEMYSIVWDFAGQPVYYATHPLFLTQRAVYLLVFDLSRGLHARADPTVKQGMYSMILDNHDCKSNLDYLDFWMTWVASIGNQDENQQIRLDQSPMNIPPVFLVCTHADEPCGGADPFVLAREVFGSLETKPYKNQLYQDVFVVDNTKSGSKAECSEVKRLWEKVRAVAKELPQMKEDYPVKWLRFEKALQTAVREGKKWISLEETRLIASKLCHIEDDQGFATLLNFLHDQRILIHFDSSPLLNNMVILDPQWLVELFTSVITVKPGPYEGKERELWRRLQTEGILEYKLLELVWDPLSIPKEMFPSLLEIMEKFSLLCPWPSSDASCSKQYLVPSMLMSHPPKDIIKLVASAQIPSFYIRFESGQVPPGFFPRLVLQFFQWGQDGVWRAENPQLYANFARFYTSADDDCSVILRCHSSCIEVVVHRGNASTNLIACLQSKLNLSAVPNYDGFEEACARAVRRQLVLMLECMREEFFWFKNMKYKIGVICPVCCQESKANYCCKHHKQWWCEQEECLHFISESDLRKAKDFIRCLRCPTAEINKVHVKRFAPWFETSDEQAIADASEPRHSASGGGIDEKLPVLPSKAIETLMSQPCDSREVVLQLKDCLKLDEVVLEHPDSETKRLIRCLANKAKQSNRPDVLRELREITPAGTTGPLLPECLDVMNIPTSQIERLTLHLSGGQEWKQLAEKLGLAPHEIRFLDNRVMNPCEAAIAFIARQRYITVGELYDTISECELPLVADIL